MSELRVLLSTAEEADQYYELPDLSSHQMEVIIDLLQDAYEEGDVQTLAFIEEIPEERRGHVKGYVDLKALLCRLILGLD